LKSANRKTRLRVQGRYTTNNLTSIKEMAMAGLGITLMPMVLCKAEIEAKQLEIILPNWVAHETPVNFLYQKEFLTAPKITAFIDFVAPAVRPIFEPS
jgi:DNA-binding transcriptional LysR family regulator